MGHRPVKDVAQAAQVAQRKVERVAQAPTKPLESLIPCGFEAG